MHEYVFKMKKGDIEIELKSDDLEFVEEQLNKWREDLLQQKQKQIDEYNLKNISIKLYKAINAFFLTSSTPVNLSCFSYLQ